MTYLKVSSVYNSLAVGLGLQCKKIYMLQWHKSELNPNLTNFIFTCLYHSLSCTSLDLLKGFDLWIMNF